MIIYTAKNYAIRFGDMDFKYEKKVEIKENMKYHYGEWGRGENSMSCIYWKWKWNFVKIENTDFSEPDEQE